MPVLLKLTGRPVHCGALLTKLATGVELIAMVCVLVCVQPPPETVKLTVLVPDEAYTMPPGFSADEPAGLAPNPKLHAYDQFPPVLPVLVKLIGTLLHWGALLVNEAVGD